jgi:hypothetical protein
MESEKLSNLIVNILSDAISAITILEVKSETTFEGKLALYIKTDDLSTVDIPLLEEIVSKNSSDEFFIRFLIPDFNFIKKSCEKNTDTICIYIKKN